MIGIVTLFYLFGVVACGKEGEKKEAAKVEEKIEAKSETGEMKFPHGHPSITGMAEQATGGGKAGTEGEADKASVGHPFSGEGKKEIRVPDEVKTKWKTVHLKIVDKDKNTEETFMVAVGKEATIKNTGFAVKVDAFLPHYMRFDTYISSKSNEPVNPAVLVELLENGKSIAKGWVFANFAQYNSYKHERYEIVLLPIALK